MLVTLFRQSRATERALFRANDLNITSKDLREFTTASHLSELSSESNFRTSNSSQAATRWYFRMLPGRFRRHRGGTRVEARLHRLEDRFITIAIKISLYPLALILINAFISTEDLRYTVRGGVRDQCDYIMYCIYYFLYGGRGMFFALVSCGAAPT